MIIPHTPSFYSATAEGETAENLVATFSPKVASDIRVISLTSRTYDSDVESVADLQKILSIMEKATPDKGLDPLHQSVKFNPLYIPGPVEDLDMMLNLDARSDGIRFTGMEGDPYALMTATGTQAGEVLYRAKVAFQPFDIPLYSEVVALKEGAILN